MNLFSQFRTDERKEKEGIEITYAPNEDGTTPTFRVRRRGPSNQEYVKALEHESAPYRRMLELGTLSNRQQEIIMRRVFCSAVLVGWDHVQAEDGKLIPYNFNNAIKLFETLPELYLDLSEQSGKLAAFRLETQESDAKN